MEIELTRAVACGLLGLDLDPTPEQIKAAFRKMAKETHPDHGGDAEVFKRVKAAYDLLVEAPVQEAVPDPQQGQEEELKFGDWLDVRSLMLDGRLVPGRIRAQITVIEGEILIGVYLDEPWAAGSGVAYIVLSEKGHEEIGVYSREVVSRSFDIDGTLTAFWLSPYERRMHQDGHPMDEPPAGDSHHRPPPPPPQWHPPPQYESYRQRYWREYRQRYDREKTRREAVREFWDWLFGLRY